MMKLKSGNTIIFGLSDENLRRLQLGQPIAFDGAEVMIPGMRFVIMHGATEMAMEQALIDAGFKVPQ